MTEDQIKHMVDRFLGWRLPEDFHPDAGISFKKTFNDHMPHPMKHEPIGTNLFDAIQATAMVRYMLEGISTTYTPTGGSRMTDPFSDYNLMVKNCGRIERGDARAIRVSAEHYLWLCSARSTVAAITQTAGGEVEGLPTSVINILQRIRKLVETERAHAHSSTEHNPIEKIEGRQ